MVSYNNILFENRKSVLLYMSILSSGKISKIPINEKEIVTEDKISEEWDKVFSKESKMVALPVYSFTKWI